VFQHNVKEKNGMAVQLHVFPRSALDRVRYQFVNVFVLYPRKCQKSFPLIVYYSTN